MTETDSLDDLLADLQAADVRVRANGDKLKIDAPPGALTPALTARLKASKAALLERLSADAPPPALPPVTPRAAGVVAAVACAQERMLTLERILGGSSVHNIATIIDLNQAADAERLAQAIAAITAAHEALRLRFDDGLQQTDVAAPILQVIDATDWSAEELAAAQHEEAHRPFDLAGGPVHRWCLYRRPDGDQIQVTLHGTIYDAWAGGLLYRDLIRAYDGETLVPAAVQIGDVAVWERSWLAGEAFAARLRFWRNDLRGLPALPISGGRPSYRGGELHAELPGASWSALRAQSSQCGCAPFVSLLTIMHACLWRLGGQEDVAVVTPVSGRTRPELNEVVGCLLNLVPHRGRIDGGRTWREQVAACRGQVLARIAHQEAPLGPVLDALAAEGDGAPAVPSVLFNLMAREERSDRQHWARARGLRSVAMDAVGQDLAWYLIEHDDHLQIKLRYDAERIGAAGAERALEQFLRLIDDFLARPDGLLAAAPDGGRLQATSARRGSTPPQGPVECALAAAMAAELGLPACCREDNFFDCGGSSLQAARLAERLGREQGWQLEPQDLFARDIAALAARCSGNAS